MGERTNIIFRRGKKENQMLYRRTVISLCASFFALRFICLLFTEKKKRKNSF